VRKPMLLVSAVPECFIVLPYEFLVGVGCARPPPCPPESAKPRQGSADKEARVRPGEVCDAGQRDSRQPTRARRTGISEDAAAGSSTPAPVPRHGVLLLSRHTLAIIQKSQSQRRNGPPSNRIARGNWWQTKRATANTRHPNAHAITKHRPSDRRIQRIQAVDLGPCWQAPG